MHTRTSTYGYDPRGEPTRPEVRPSEHLSQGRRSLGSPKELETTPGRAKLLRELESHCGEQHWDTREIIGLREYSIRGYGSNLALLLGTSGAETETESLEKPTPEKK
ncbi:hypothetical protein LXL04_033926 [Taraxacum kok-saghyz]